MRENNRYNSRMLEDRNPPVRLPLPHRRPDARPGARLAPQFEAVDEDFDDAALEDLRHQAASGRIDVADL